MGCYMSKPDDKVYLTEGSGRNFYYATASCQGWRREQEDAEACIPDFDEDASLFVLCDGHGGAEVAKYTVEHYPDFLKNHSLYKKQKYEIALQQSFKDFDALLRTDAVLDELNRIALDEKCKKEDDEPANEEMEDVNQEKCDEMTGLDEPSSSSAAGPSCSGPSGSSSSSSSNRPDTVAEDVDAETLRRDATVPIEVLRHKYSRSAQESSEGQSSGHGSLNEEGDHDENKPQPSSSSSSGIAQEDLREVMKKAIAQYFNLNDDDDDVDDNSDDDSEFEGDNSSSSDADKDDDDEEEEEDEDEDDEDAEDENDDDEDGDDERDDETSANDDEKKNSRRKKYKKRRRSKGSSQNDSSSEDDDDDDSEEEENDDEEEDDEDDDDDDLEDEEDDQTARRAYLDGLQLPDEWYGLENGLQPWRRLRNMNPKLKTPTRVHKPGIDSGCTVVVALLKGKKLYVASAGDSRCIVILRDGQFKPMSIDHKPEDYIEYSRIINAGGRVTEGRVNGGLNLSRAFGDFTYKDAKLQAEHQMITPYPDVRVADVDPEKVEYIFLACDGIWNSMKNQQVTKFLRKLAPNVKNNLVQLCLGLFNFCIAPGTDGDGTGCDNMTCILARFLEPGEQLEQSDLKKTTTTLAETKIPTTTTTSETKDSSSAGEQLETTETSTSSASRKKRASEALDEERKRICLRIENSGGY